MNWILLSKLARSSSSKKIKNSIFYQDKFEQRQPSEWVSEIKSLFFNQLQNRKNNLRITKPNWCLHDELNKKEVCVTITHANTSRVLLYSILFSVISPLFFSLAFRYINLPSYYYLLKKREKKKNNIWIISKKHRRKTFDEEEEEEKIKSIAFFQIKVRKLKNFCQKTFHLWVFLVFTRGLEAWVLNF